MIFAVAFCQSFGLLRDRTAGRSHVCAVFEACGLSVYGRQLGIYTMQTGGGKLEDAARVHTVTRPTVVGVQTPQA